MFYFRLYFFSGARIISVEDFHADSDAEAVAKAGEYVGPLTLELWSGSRRVHWFDAQQRTG